MRLQALAGILVLVFFVGCIHQEQITPNVSNISMNVTPSPRPIPAPMPSPTPTPKPTYTLYEMNRWINITVFKIMVTDVEKLGRVGNRIALGNHDIVAVDLRVMNLIERPLTIDPSKFYITDSKGKKYMKNEIVESLSFIGGKFTIGTGDMGKVYFDVPKTSTDLEFHFVYDSDELAFDLEV